MKNLQRIILKYFFMLPYSIGFTSYIRFLYFFYIKKSFKTFYQVNDINNQFPKKDQETVLQNQTKHTEDNFKDIFFKIKNKFNGKRSSILINPLKSMDCINFKKSRVLSIGPRLESEIFNLIKNGFKKKNIFALDLQTYSPLIQLGNMTKMPYEDNYFDIVFCGWVLSYSNEIQKAANEMIRVVKNGGYIALGISNKPNKQFSSESLFNSSELKKYFRNHTENIIFNYHPGDFINKIDKKYFRCALILRIKK